MNKVYAFDFDGTLTKRDTLFCFLRFALGNKGFAMCMLRFLPMMIMAKIGLMEGGDVKQRILSLCFKDMPEATFAALCQRFAGSSKHLLRPKGTKLISQLASQPDTTIAIVSASVDTWVRPFFAQYPDIVMLCTAMEVSNGKLTGRFATPNCNKQEKVKRLLQRFPNRRQYYLVAYGDSSGDIPMLDLANEGHYREL